MSDADLKDPVVELRDRQLSALAALLQLERRVRAAATVEELGFLMVNDTHMIVPYRQAVFWRADTEKVQAISGLSTPDRDAPFCLWLARLFRARLAAEAGIQVDVLSAQDLPAGEQEFW